MAGIGISGGRTRSWSSSSSPIASMLLDLGKRFTSGQSEDVRSGLLTAMQEVLSTGGSNIPIISRTIDASRSASSRALMETEQDLAQSGLAGTPFGENILATQRQKGEVGAAQVGESLAQNIFNMISQFILGQGQLGVGALTGGLPGMTTTRGTESGSAFNFGAGLGGGNK